MKKLIAAQAFLLAATAALVAIFYVRHSQPGSVLAVAARSVLMPNAAAQAESLPLINPVVASGLKKHFIIDFQPLKASLEKYLGSYNGKGYVYFSYLNNAAWVGIRERELITAASTVKVPIAMTVYKAIEEGKLTGKESYTLTENDLNSGFGDLYEIGSDKTLSLEELVKIMLERSDNTAANALMSIFDRIGIDDPLDGVYNAMGWVTYGFIGSAPVSNYGQISLKVLSNMFLSLYNATYVNPAHSQAILSYLSKSLFKDQIDAGVPDSVPVAHKIGVYDDDLTYSDCGIVYASNRNYLLCIASVGKPAKEATAFIASVSKIVYDYVMNN